MIQLPSQFGFQNTSNQPVNLQGSSAVATAPQPTQSQTTQPQQNSGLDPQVINLAKAIRQEESGGNFQAKGKSGEFGAYQWMPNTWAADSQKYLGQSVPFGTATPAQQNEVAYKKIADWKAAGYNVGQIASMWNAGGDNPNAYLTGNSGTNSSGASYNTSTYAKNVATIYQKLKAQGTPGIGNLPGPQTANTPIQTDNGGKVTQDTQDFGPLSGLFHVGQTVTNFALPIIGDVYNDMEGKSDKTILQQAGDAGMSALWFLPFGDIAEGLGAGAKALGLGAKAAKIAGTIATGLGTGYASDVANHLAQGQTGAGVLKPGLGTVIGGGVAGAAEGVSSLYDKFVSQQGAIDKVTQAYEDAAGSTKTGIRDMSKTATQGLQSNPEFLAHAGIAPETEEINGRRVFTTGADSASQKTIQSRISDLTDLRDQAISKANGTSDLEGLRQQAIQKAQTEFSGTARQTAIDHINTEFDAYKAQYDPDGDGKVSITDMNTIKKDLQGKTNYDATRPTLITQANKIMGSLAKTQVETDAAKAGVPAIGELNKIIQQHIDSLDFLNKINGQTVKGGRLGSYLYKGIGAGIGGLVSHATGGGLIGSIAEPLLGEIAGGKLSDFMQKLAAGGSVTSGTLGRMASEDPQVVQQFLDYLGENSGQKIAPILKPTQSAGVLSDLLKNTPGSRILKGLSGSK